MQMTFATVVFLVEKERREREMCMFSIRFRMEQMSPCSNADMPNVLVRENMLKLKQQASKSNQQFIACPAGCNTRRC